MGPSRRRYANAVITVATHLLPDELLHHLKQMERAAGRRPGLRWGSRPLDLDIILWSGGCWHSPGLTIPHTAYRDRGFVLTPLCAVAPLWIDPINGKTPRQLLFRNKKRIKCAMLVDQPPTPH